MSAGSYWKNPTNSNQDTMTFGTFQAPGTTSFSSPSSSSHTKNRKNEPPSHNDSNGSGNGGFREAGIVEKLLGSYGFIQCCERQARLFFHYSQFDGILEHLKLGDPVEFEMTYDLRTGKPVASLVSKIGSDAFNVEDMASPDQPGQLVKGFITTEPANGKDGRVAYENRGECFFLPFTLDDIEPGSCLRGNDKVSFRIAADKSGNLRARRLSLLESTPDRFQGVICTLKDSFGFIERADIVKEIFFHSSECTDFKEFRLSDEVEFGIQTRNDKVVATSVIQLPKGTVSIEEVSKERYRGLVARCPEKGFNFNNGSGSQGEPGIIQGLTEPAIELKFNPKDLKGEFTLNPDDLIWFHIVTDKRDGSKRAGRIELHEDCFSHRREKRETGYISSLKEAFGFIKCLDRDGTRIYFKLSEILDQKAEVNINDEVEFTLITDGGLNNSRYQAVRIKFIPNGTIMSNLLYTKNTDYPLVDLGMDDSSINLIGGIEHGMHGGSAVRKDTWEELLQQIPININQSTNGTSMFNKADSNPSSFDNIMNLNDTNLMDFTASSGKNGNRPQNGRGILVALKDKFGFIEQEDHQSEVFFHFRNFRGNISEANLGDEVDFTYSWKNGKMNAEMVKVIPSNSVQREDVLEPILSGNVIRTVRCLNIDQDDYTGNIKVSDGAEGYEKVIEFSMTSLADIQDFVQKGDQVSFQVGICPITGKERAVNVRTIRNKQTATVESIKGNYGFLNFDVEEGKKLFFHMSDFKGMNLQAGDTVEFAIVHNQKSNKYSACSLTRCSPTASAPRPEHLISKLKMKSADTRNKIIVLRQPRGPDGTKGFISRVTA